MAQFPRESPLPVDHILLCRWALKGYDHIIMHYQPSSCWILISFLEAKTEYLEYMFYGVKLVFLGSLLRKDMINSHYEKVSQNNTKVTHIIIWFMGLTKPKQLRTKSADPNTQKSVTMLLHP